MAVGNPYLTGKPTYGKTSTTSPTQGTVDPSGYITRQLTQNRSGLAAAALNRLGMSASQLQQQPRDDWGNVITSNTPQQAPRSPSSTINNYINRWRNRTPTGRIVPPSTSGGGVPMGIPTPQGSVRPVQGGGTANNPVLQDALKQLLAGNTGGMDFSAIIEALGKAGPGMSNNVNIGFDAQAGDEQAALMAQRNAALLQFMTQAQDLEGQFADQQRGLQQQIPSALREVLGNFAGRGMAFSSGYANEVGETNNQFANALSDLSGQRTRGLRDIIMGRIGFDENYQNALGAIQTAAARRLAEQAGDLNLNPDGPGNITPPPLPVVTPGNGTQPGAPGNETESQRIARITQEIMSGQRDFNSVRRSVDMIAGRQGQTYDNNNADASFMGNPALIAQRIRDIFMNRGVPIGTGAYS